MAKKGKAKDAAQEPASLPEPDSSPVLGALDIMGNNPKVPVEVHGQNHDDADNQTIAKEISDLLSGKNVTQSETKKVPAKRTEQQKKKTGDKKSKIVKGPPKSPGEQFYSFEIRNKPDVHFRTTKEAIEFKRDYKEIITKEHKFTTITRFESHCKRRSGLGSASPTARTDNSLTATTNSDVDQIVATLNAERAADTILGSAKSTPNSTKAVVFFDLRTVWNSSFWGFKPAIMAAIFTRISDVKPAPDMTVQECLQNMSFGKARDKDNGDAGTPLVVHYTPPGKKDVILIDVFQMWSMITIPHETIATSAEEATWMKDTTERICNHLRDIMMGPIFKEVLKRTVHENFFEKLYASDRKSNLPKFLNTCIIKYKPCVHYTDHVIQEVSNSIVDKMYECRIPQRKYPDEHLDAEFALVEKDLKDELMDSEQEEEEEQFGSDEKGVSA